MSFNALLILINLFIWAYHFIAWIWFKKRFASSENKQIDLQKEITPMMASFIRNKSSGYKLMVTGIISLACGGYLDIFEDDGEFILYKRNDIPKDHPPEEALIFNSFFHDKNAVLIGKNNFSALHNLMIEITNMLYSPEITNKYFINGRMPLYVGAFFSFSAILYFAVIENLSAVLILSTTAVINFVIYFFLLETYTNTGRAVLNRLAEIEDENKFMQKENIYEGIPWSVVFGKEEVYDGYIKGETVEWFDVFDGAPVNYLTGLQRESNRLDQKYKFVPWLSETLYWSLINAKTLYGHSGGAETFGQTNPLDRKRESQKEKLIKASPGKNLHSK